MCLISFATYIFTAIFVPTSFLLGDFIIPNIPGAPWSSPSPWPWRCRRLRSFEIFGLGQPAIAAGGGAWHVTGCAPTQRIPLFNSSGAGLCKYA